MSRSPHRSCSSPRLGDMSAYHVVLGVLGTGFDCDDNNPHSSKKASLDLYHRCHDSSAVDLKSLNLESSEFQLRRQSYTETVDSSSEEDEGHSFSFVSNGTRKFNAPEVAFSKRGASPKSKMFASSSPPPLNPQFSMSNNSLDRPHSPDVRPKSSSSSHRNYDTDTSSLVKMYLELKDVHSELLVRHDATISQNESMKHSVIALERALADSRTVAQSSADTSQTETLKLANIKLKEELRWRCKEVQDLLIARNLPSYDLLDRDDSTPTQRVSSAAPLEQLKAISAKNDELARELENAKLQLAFERRRREQVEEEVHILRSLHLHSRSHHPPTGKGGTLRMYNQHHEVFPASSPCHGANPTVDLPWYKPTDHHPRTRNVTEPRISPAVVRYR